MKPNQALVAAGLCAAGIALAAPPFPGDPAKAQAIAAQSCAACHGPDGNSAVPAFPRLAGQQPEYLLRELQDYLNGRRESEVMAPVVKPLAEADLANLAAYFAAQKPAPGTPANPALLALGKKVYLEGNPKSGVPSCDGCHEEDGSGSKRFPRLAGQHAEYTLDQLRRYASGKRGNGGKAMRTVAERLTDAEARAVAEYVAGME